MVNYLAMFIAALASFVFGFLYYMPNMYTGKKWMELAGTQDVKPEGAAWRMPVGFISTLVMVYVLARILEYAAAVTYGAAIGIAVLVWAGFIGTTTLGSFLWERKPFSLWILNNIYNVIGAVIMAVILIAMG